ncbi:MAG TPA: hypothetical protein VGH76_17495 [Actinomycetospora sp.]|uniref:hypothetical protein n=1 Tax=Actinomycetospora sp. TaxID=1872135 RepID=UPI002F41B3F9
MTSPDEGDASVVHDGDLSTVARARLRSALTGSIFAMSVLAYLGSHETGLVAAVVTVVGTGLVIFFGEAYAGLLSASLASTAKLPRAEIREELGTSSMAAAPGVLAGVLLVLVDLLGSTVQTGIDIALWAGVLTLTALSVLEAHGSHRSLPVRVASVVGSVLVGVVVIVLKATLH